MNCYCTGISLTPSDGPGVRSGIRNRGRIGPVHSFNLKTKIFVLEAVFFFKTDWNIKIDNGDIIFLDDDDIINSYCKYYIMNLKYLCLLTQ